MIMQAVESQAVESGERSRLSGMRRSDSGGRIKLAHEKSYGLDRGGGFITACLKTKSQTWRNCPMAGVVGALILFPLKNYPFAGKKAFTIKDTSEVDTASALGNLPRLTVRF